jgi:tRNA-Thr(GGU) m(6)t(6)A37 methyltransferase TsaA
MTEPSPVVVEPCGVARTPYTVEGQGPIQGALREDVESRLEIFPEYETCLDGLEGFSHLVVLFHFHLVPPKERSLRTKPYLYDRQVGAFACCSPRRPSGIGLDVVRLIRREGNVLVVAGTDMLDGSPVLDVRPYIPKFHSLPDAELGWIKNRVPDEW